MDKITTPTQHVKADTQRYRYILACSALLAVNGLVFCYTTPLNGPALVVILGFLLISVDVTLFWYVTIGFFGLLLPRVRQYRRRLTTVLSGLSVTAIALASLGQLTLRDMTVVAVIAVVGYFYSLRFGLHRK